MGNISCRINYRPTDIGFKTPSVGQYASSICSTYGSWSRCDLFGRYISSPDQAFGVVQSNFMNNYQAMAIQSLGIGIGFRLGKRLLRRPISNVNSNIFKPLGAGFKL